MCSRNVELCITTFSTLETGKEVLEQICSPPTTLMATQNFFKVIERKYFTFFD